MLQPLLRKGSKSQAQLVSLFIALPFLRQAAVLFCCWRMAQQLPPWPYHSFEEHCALIHVLSHSSLRCKCWYTEVVYHPTGSELNAQRIVVLPKAQLQPSQAPSHLPVRPPWPRPYVPIRPTRPPAPFPARWVDCSSPGLLHCMVRFLQVGVFVKACLLLCFAPLQARTICQLKADRLPVCRSMSWHAPRPARGLTYVRPALPSPAPASAGSGGADATEQLETAPTALS